jgi:hypothetical protein
MVMRLPILVVLVASLGFAPRASADPSHDDIASVGPDARLLPATPPASFGKGLAALSVAGVYLPFATWAYFAWFRGAHQVPFWFDTAWNDEKLGLHTYAGGADKFGHMWSNYVLARGTTALLTAGGWSRLSSSLISAGLAELYFTMSEIKDGYVWGFEVGDAVGNVSGAVLAVLMENIPVIDRLFDFRLEYFPSHAYLHLAAQKPFSRGDGLDISQDYTGQSYMLALHLGELPGCKAVVWLKYFDAVVGFEARNYEPTDTKLLPVHQTQYLGVAINMQALLDTLFRDSSGRRIGHGIFEVYSVPYTTAHLAEYTRTWDRQSAPPAL